MASVTLEPVAAPYSDRDALLRAILETPACDVARLVFADWLDEHGEPERAEYIRYSVGSARLGAKPFLHSTGQPATACYLGRRVWGGSQPRLEPLDVHIADAVPGAALAVFRGFVPHIELSAAAFLKHGEAIFRAQPVTSVRLTDRVPETGVFHRSNEPTWHLQDKRYWLWDLVRDGWIASQCIPWGIFKYIRNDVGALGIKQYLSEDRAHEALSRACVNYGRALAGLTPLPEPESPRVP